MEGPNRRPRQKRAREVVGDGSDVEVPSTSTVPMTEPQIASGEVVLGSLRTKERIQVARLIVPISTFANGWRPCDTLPFDVGFVLHPELKATVVYVSPLHRYFGVDYRGTRYNSLARVVAAMCHDWRLLTGDDLPRTPASMISNPGRSLVVLAGELPVLWATARLAGQIAVGGQGGFIPFCEVHGDVVKPTEVGPITLPFEVRYLGYDRLSATVVDVQQIGAKFCVTVEYEQRRMSVEQAVRRMKERIIAEVGEELRAIVRTSVRLNGFDKLVAVHDGKTMSLRSLRCARALRPVSQTPALRNLSRLQRAKVKAGILTPEQLKEAVAEVTIKSPE